MSPKDQKLDEFLRRNAPPLPPVSPLTKQKIFSQLKDEDLVSKRPIWSAWKVWSIPAFSAALAFVVMNHKREVPLQVTSPVVQEESIEEALDQLDWDDFENQEDFSF